MVVGGKGGGVLVLILLLLLVVLTDPVEAAGFAVELEVAAEKGLRKRGESGGVRSPAGRDPLPS